MFKKIVSLALVAIMCVSCLALASCGPTEDVFKIGFICLHDEKSTYDLNFINAAKAAQTAMGLTDEQVIIKTQVPETDACYQAAADLVDQGCDIIFANSFGHEQFMIQAAKEFTDVEFCHATGTQAHVENLPNFHNAFASIYEGRYLAGIAAGLKLNEMIEAGEFTAEEAKIGYVGAFTYAEVISGYTSFYLGAKSVCPTVTMDVQFTGSWFHITEESNAAKALIARGCKLISQHADSMGAPSACEAEGIPNVSYNGSTQETCPNTFIVASRIDWAPYFKYIIDCAMNSKTIATDWCGGINEGSVVLTEINTNVAAEGTQAAIDAAIAAFKAGTLNVFDTANFTYNNGTTLDTTWKPGAGTDASFVDGTVLVKDGVFYESDYRSAPYFDCWIDGINLINQVYDPID